jgi:hypothetical protein
VFAHLPLLHLYTPTNEQKGKAEGRERRVDAGDGGGGEKEGRSRGRVYCLYFSGSVPWWGWLHENGESVQLSRERKKRRVMGQGGRSVGKEKEEKANALDHVEPRQNSTSSFGARHPGCKAASRTLRKGACWRPRGRRAPLRRGRLRRRSRASPRDGLREVYGCRCEE